MTNTFRIRPKSDYLQKASWKDLFLLAEHWQSDMDFFRDELKFLHRLVDKYFILLIKEEHLSQTQSIVIEIENLSKKVDQINENIVIHLDHLEAIIGKSSMYDKQKFRDEHEQLEEKLVVFTKHFWKVKKDVFGIMENMLREDKLQHLIA